MKPVKTYPPKTKILSLILSFLIIFYLVPASVFAEGLDNDTTVYDSSVSANEENNTYTPEIYEVTELREENVKHFRLEDGSYVAAQYNYPVHYTDVDGQLVDIDNRLVELGGELSTDNSRIKFVKKITGNGNIFTIHENNTKITMGLVGAEKKTQGVVASTNNSDDAIEDALGKMTNLENISSTILYEDILDGVDIEYIIHSLNIKENIIVKEKKDNYSYTFTLNLNNLTANLTENGDVHIVSLDGETQYIIPAPVVYDTNGNYAPDNVSAYSLSTTGNGKYELNVTVASDWMNSDERIFPITIDPTIGVPHSYTTDLDIASGAPSVSFEDSFSLNVSSTWRSYWIIPSEYLPTLPSTAHIWKAELKLFGGGYNTYVGAYEISSNWDETLTWNKTISSNPQGLFSGNMLDYHKLSSGDNWYAFDLTEVAKKWYNGENNYGVGFKLVDGTDTTRSASFYSYEYYDDYDDRFVEPCFYIYYSDISGLEDYYSLSSHAVAGSVSGSVNLASGNLTIISDLVSTTDYLMPMTVSAVYNSDMSGKEYIISDSFNAHSTSYMPYGFKLNISETIVEKSMRTEDGGSINYCILSDADGTNHYFYYIPFEGYIDDSAQGRTLNKLSTNEIEITYKDQSKKLFTKMSANPTGTTGGWVLSKITDPSGNSVIITLDSNYNYRPTKISLLPSGDTTVIDMVAFSYSGGRLYKVHSPNSLDYATFSYSSTYNGSTLSSTGNYLRRITYGNSNVTGAYTSAQIEYYSNGNIKSVQDNSSLEKITYVWNSKKVSQISEYAGETIGQQIAYTYGEGYTDIRFTGNNEILYDSDDLVNRYLFDIYGRTVSAHSYYADNNQIIGATMNTYEDEGKAKNNIKESAIVYDGKATYLSTNEENYDRTLQGGIDKTAETGCYKITVFEENNPAGILYSNADMEYVISGFGRSNSIIQNDNAKFSLSVNVYYYQGEGVEDIVVSHHYDFRDVEDTWQFVSGKVDCKLATSSPSIYDVVRKIEVVYNYYGQINTNGAAPYAEFKDVAFTDFSDINSYRYAYDVSTGNLVMKNSSGYKEYYEYNDKNSITRIANNKGSLYDYEYADDGTTLTREIYYKFNRQGSFPGNLLYDYPYGENNIEDKIYKTRINQTGYVYTDQGLLSRSQSYCEASVTAGIITLSYTYDETEGSKIFGALLTETDSLGHTTKYFYDSTNGELLAQINVDEGNGYVYEYNEWGVLEGVMPATGSATSYSVITNAENVNYEYDPNTNRLNKIKTDSTEYSFSYDAFGNSTGVAAGNNTLATYEYYPNNGKLKKINYGNGFSEDYLYDSLEMLSQIWYTYDDGTEELAYSYTYNKDGTPDVFTNHLDGTSIKYEYDVHGRFVSASETNLSDPNYRNEYEVNNYDADGRVTRTTNTISYLANSAYNPLYLGYQYTYNNDGTLKEERILSSAVPTTIVDYYYDSFNRTTKVDRRIDGFRYTTDYTYYLKSNNTNELVSEVTSTINDSSTTYNYTYDSNGNITKIVIGDKEIRYTYDNLGQLLSEENELTNQSFTYTYDNAGNIKSKKVRNLTTGVVASNNTYYYSSSAWGDMLTAFGSTGQITYDAIGNPLTYNNGTTYHFTWEGRQLTRAAVGNYNYTFTYNDEGIRTSKTLPSGTCVEYVLNGSQIVAEMTDTYTIVYMYDASGSPIGMKHRLSSYAAGVFNIFWFEKNLQGDIVAVYNSDGVKCISYIYDAWGKILKTTTHNSTGTNAYASRNPFRYRGYYYDVDLRLYYLQSRYYDPNTCRFISPDTAAVLTATPIALTDKNLYAYCDNNPVTRVDGDGEFWNVIIGAAVGATVSLVSAIISEIIEGEIEWKDIGQIAISTAIGAAEGALIAVAPGASVAISAIGSALETAINDSIDGKDLKTIAVNSAISAAIGAAGGAGSSSFIKGGKLINEAASAMGNVIGKGIHPAVRKSAEKIVNKATKYIVKSAVNSFTEDIVYMGIYDFSSWYTNSIIDRAFGR